jgi:glucose 1-dehydrogenase
MPKSAAPLAQQTAVVTGANSGIGEAIARAMAAAGAAVVVNYVTHPETAARIVADITGQGGRALAVQADVSDEAQVQAMFARAVQEFGTVDIVASNAGLQDDAPFLEMTVAKWQHVLDVNLTGGFLCAREGARQFVKQGIRDGVSRAAGKIIFTSSVHQVIPWAGHVNYATSKGGMMQLMESTAQELARHKIRVNSIAPGAIKTPINRAAWDTADAERQLLTLIPYDRVGEPADIGRVAAWLASDEADYVTGTTLFVDGGMTLFPGFSTGHG